MVKVEASVAAKSAAARAFGVCMRLVSSGWGRTTLAEHMQNAVWGLVGCPGAREKQEFFCVWQRFPEKKQIRHSGDGRNCRNAGKVALIVKFAKKTKTDGIVAVKSDAVLHHPERLHA
jgi:hypothetical protein